jgi:DNA-3-methyladenine glycosylase I
MPETIIPPRAQPDGDDGYLEQLSKAVFQAGFNWQIVERKWPDIRRAFEAFSVERVAALSPESIDTLLQDPAIIRNRRKVEAVVWNARKILALRAEHGSFHAYLRTLDGRGYRKVSKELQNTFEHLGRTGAYVFLWSVGEEVPDWEAR